MSASHARSRPPGAVSFAVDVLDIEALRDRAGRDEPFVVELLEDFLCRGVTMQDLLAAAEASELERLGKLAHKLKGALLSLGATSASASAGEVELRAGTLAIAPDPSEPRGLAALTTSVAELGRRFDVARDAMRCVMDHATSMTPTSSR